MPLGFTREGGTKATTRKPGDLPSHETDPFAWRVPRARS